MIHLSSWSPPTIHSLAGRVESMGMGGGGKDPWFRKAGTAHRTSQKKRKIHSLHVYYFHFCGVGLCFCLFGFVQPYVLHLPALFFGMVNIYVRC